MALPVGTRAVLAGLAGAVTVEVSAPRQRQRWNAVRKVVLREVDRRRVARPGMVDGLKARAADRVKAVGRPQAQVSDVADSVVVGSAVADPAAAEIPVAAVAAVVVAEAAAVVVDKVAAVAASLRT